MRAVRLLLSEPR
ncbi:Hypothetical protein SLIV_24828 [Streptomyces lividans TK24]|uniref:Uncharacterized protein n=1 Tax=Streptomyces lividans TK24 TaxID=457428 RepID=A0ABX6TQL4_STRLI|nr:Hypothetical protein SLIV_24828 [Streptomyces lividans TK24]QSJ11459.1 Hypothetical protein SLIVDG2_24828 [Streptomyces lividans]QTD72369.1 Hypothetical protein SLIVYQS_24828 [Streptomyces lividans TK24] [Streptomyces lividans]